LFQHWYYLDERYNDAMRDQRPWPESY